MVLPVDMAGFTAERAGPLILGQQGDGPLHNAVPVRLQELGRLDRVGEGNGASQGAGPPAVGSLVLRILESLPAADNLRGVIEVDQAAGS